MDVFLVDSMVKVIQSMWPKLPHSIHEAENGLWSLSINIEPIFVVHNEYEWDEFWKTHLVLLKEYA